MVNSQGIEGVPVGCKIAKVGAVTKGAWVIDPTGKLIQVYYDGAYQNVVMLAPDNVYATCDLSTIPIPSGYERDGETAEEWFREPSMGEKVITSQGFLSMMVEDYAFHPASDKRRIILRPIKPKTRKVLVIEITDPTAEFLANQGEQGRASRVGHFTCRNWRLEERPC